MKKVEREFWMKDFGRDDVKEEQFIISIGNDESDDEDDWEFDEENDL